MTESNDPAIEPAQPESAKNSFEAAAQEQEPGLVAEFLDFLHESKGWWMTPILIVLVIVGVLVYLGSSVVAPFIYPLF